MKIKKTVWGVFAFTFSFMVGMNIAFSGSLNSMEKGYELAANSWTKVEFNKAESGSSTTDMWVKNSCSTDLFVGTKRNSEFSSFLKNGPSCTYSYKETNTNDGSCLDWLVRGSTSDDNEMIQQIYVPAAARYRFLMKMQRQDFEDYEDIYLYVDLNKDGDYNDSGEYLGRSNDTYGWDAYWIFAEWLEGTYILALWGREFIFYLIL